MDRQGRKKIGWMNEPSSMATLPYHFMHFGQRRMNVSYDESRRFWIRVPVWTSLRSLSACTDGNYSQKIGRMYTRRCGLDQDRTKKSSSLATLPYHFIGERRMNVSSHESYGAGDSGFESHPVRTS